MDIAENAEQQDVDNEPDFSKLPGDDNDLPEQIEENDDQSIALDDTADSDTPTVETTEQKVSLRQHIKAKRQRNEARDRLEAEAKERERLENELAEARAQLAQQQTAQDLPPVMPTMDDPDIAYDDVKYREAVNSYRLDLAQYNERVAQRAIEKDRQAQRTGINAEEIQKRQTAALDAHYDRAEKLGINPQKYLSLEEKVVNAIGETAFNTIAAEFSRSEGIMAHLGSNQQALDEVQNLLKTNPLRATIRLAEINTKLSGHNRKQSTVTVPETEITGSASKGTDWQSRLDRARDKSLKTGNSDEVMRIRKQMRELGLTPM